MTQRQKKELQKYQNCLLHVEVKDNNVEKALSLFKRKVKNSGLLKELRDREYYEKPSIKRRRKRKLQKLRNKYID
jgi:small subunit ribosomal protein S21